MLESLLMGWTMSMRVSLLLLSTARTTRDPPVPTMALYILRMYMRTYENLSLTQWIALLVLSIPLPPRFCPPSPLPLSSLPCSLSALPTRISHSSAVRVPTGGPLALGLARESPALCVLRELLAA